MARRLAVIVGAGASFDCASELVDKRADMQPPLVKDLFGSDFAEILGRYPLAQAAAADIRRAIAPESETAVSLETYLREKLRDSNAAHTERQNRQVPLYLQDVLFSVGQTDGRGYTREPDNYNALINRAFELDEIVFLTLNYDTLLDDRLFLYERLDSLDAYIADPKWSLIKLHGSVNWGRPVPFLKVDRVQEEVAREMELGFGVDQLQLINRYIDSPKNILTDEDIELRLQPDLVGKRSDGETVYYPALSVPLGEEDQLVCPEGHLRVVLDRLRQQDVLNLLVIGYSGLDKGVRDLLRDSGKQIGNMLVANGNQHAGFEAADRLQSACGGSGVLEDNVFNGGFTDLVRSGDLAKFIARIT